MMSIDAAFFATVDPATILFTSVIAEAPLAAATPLFLENEFGHDDVNKFTALASAGDPVRSLDQATAGDRSTSDRYLDVMAPMNLGDELRAALVSKSRCWGVLCLHRADGTTGFSEEEVALVRALAPHIARGPAARPRRGRRRALPAGDAWARDHRPRRRHDDHVDERRGAAMDGRAHRSRMDRRGQWRAPGGGVRRGGGCRGAEQGRGGTPSAIRLRAADGQWLTLHASRLAVRSAACRPPSSSSRRARPMSRRSTSTRSGLTPAQTRVASLVLLGRSTQQIVSELHISSHTVQEHLRAVFDKLGVASRRELVATLLGDHH